MKRRHVIPCAIALAAAVAGCDRGDAEQLPPPAAAMSRSSDALTLEQQLERLDVRLGRVVETGLDDEARSTLYGVEAVTDRLLEEEPAVEWLASGYDVESRLRQIQALADRIIAEMRRDVASEYVLQDIAALQTSVRDLRTRMQQAGAGPAPPLLDSLLARAGDPVEDDSDDTPSSGDGNEGEEQDEDDAGGEPADDGTDLLGTPVD